MKRAPVAWYLAPVLFLPLFAQPQQSTDQVLKAIDDLEWRLKISDIADFDQVVYTSLPGP